MTSTSKIDMAVPLIDPEAQDMTYPTKPTKKTTQEQAQVVDSNDCDDALHQSTATSVLLSSATIGFLVQLVSLASYTYMLMRWGRDSATAVMTSDNIIERNLYLLLQCLSQVDLCVYSVIWVGFTLSLTTRGVRFVMSHVHDVNVSAVSSSMRRFVFLLGVHCLVGLVMGAFVSWTLIDMVLGFAVPYSRILQTVAIDLGLCYCMLLTYDCGSGSSDDEDEDEE